MLWNLFRRNFSTSTHKLELGVRGEDWAVKHLRRNGYKILVRRFCTPSGEIDVVCREKDWLVFVEVKTRESEQFGAPSEAVNSTKQRHMTKTALDYLRLLNNPQIKFRFDIVEVILPRDSKKPSDVRLIKNAFDLTEPFIY